MAFAFVVAVIDEGMVERVGNVLFDDGFQVGKVHHHAVFCTALDNGRGDGNFEFVGVAVKVLALAVMPVEHMRGIEGKDFGDFHEMKEADEAVETV